MNDWLSFHAELWRWPGAAAWSAWGAAGLRPEVTYGLGGRAPPSRRNTTLLTRLR